MFAAGVARIEEALAKAVATAEPLEFITDISLTMTTGRVGAMKYEGRPRCQ